MSSASDRSFGAAGQGQERLAQEGSAAAGRMDLLTVVAHELGHVLGFASVDAGALPHHLMTMTLTAGVRRISAASVATPQTPAVVATPIPPLPTFAASVPSAPLMFEGTAVPTEVFPALDPGWLFDRQTSPVLDDLGVATDWLPLPFPKAASPAVDWEKPLPLFPAETDSLLPSAAVEPWGEELLPFELWSDDGSEVLVGGDGDDLRIGEEGGDLLIGGIGEEAASGTAEAQK